MNMFVMAAWRTMPERDYGLLAGASYTVRHLWWGELCLVISPAWAWSPSHLSLVFFRVASSRFPLWHMQQLQTLDWLRPAWDLQSQSSPLPCSSRELPGLRSLFEVQPSAIIAHTGANVVISDVVSSRLPTGLPVWKPEQMNCFPKHGMEMP